MPIAEYECRTCGFTFSDAKSPEECQCPSCGSEHLIRNLSAKDVIKPSLDEYVRMNGKDHSRSSNEKFRREVRAGITKDVSGSRVFHRRVIDKDANHYEELVVDLATGDVRHQASQPLKEHQGHGSAKNPKKDSSRSK